MLHGGEWVINGSKIWQTAGTHANWIFALVRTDPDVAKGKGLSFLLVPYDQPGVEVRGIKTMDGGTELAEVFFTEARTAATNIVARPGDGAKVALTLLGFERASGGLAAALAAKLELLRLRDAMREFGTSDTEIRRKLAECWTSVHAMHCLALRNLTIAASGRPPGPESSISKLMMSEYRKRVTELALDVLGPRALTPFWYAVAGQPRPAAPRGGRHVVRRLGGGLPARPSGHRLRRVIGDPAQYHWRAGPWPAQGTTPRSPGEGWLSRDDL